MIKGTIDLTENRDFRTDKSPVQENTINPKTLFKSENELNKISSKEKYDFDTIYTYLQYNMPNMQIVRNDSDLAQYIDYNFGTNTSRTINIGNWEYSIYDGHTTRTFSNQSYWTDDSAGNYTIKLDATKQKSENKNLPWASKDDDKMIMISSKIPFKPDQKMHSLSSRIDCRYHGFYIGDIESKCPYCNEIMKFDGEFPWRKLDIKDYIKGFSREYVTELLNEIFDNDRRNWYDHWKYFKYSITEKDGIWNKINILPWKNSSDEKETGVWRDEYSYTMFESIPWFENMTPRQIKQYQEELFEDEDSEDTFDYEKYLNMSPNSNGVWF